MVFAAVCVLSQIITCKQAMSPDRPITTQRADFEHYMLLFPCSTHTNWSRPSCWILHLCPAWYARRVLQDYVVLLLDTCHCLLRLVDHSRSWRWFLHAMIGEFTRQRRGLALIFDYIGPANLVYNRICSFFVTTMQPCGSSLGLQLATAQWVCWILSKRGKMHAYS